MFGEGDVQTDTESSEGGETYMEEKMTREGEESTAIRTCKW